MPTAGPILKQLYPGSLLKRLSTSPGREHEQAFIRLVIGIVVFFLTYYSHIDKPSILFSVSTLVTIYTLFGVLILGWIYLQPRKNSFRYVLSNTVDIISLSYAMYLGEEMGAALYPLYLWVTFGYGFRFGIKYLAISSVLSIIGFVIVYSSTFFWQQYPILFTGMLVGLILLPIYASTLLRRLTEAVKNAEIANKAKSQFLANMSHELRTPLSGITGSSDLLKNTVLTTEQQEYANTIDYSINALLSLIESILDLSKIEEGKITRNKIDFDLHHILNITTRMLTHHAKQKGLSLNLQIEPDIPYQLFGDADHLRQVLINLIGNAIKYTDFGGVHVRVSLKENIDHECNILFEVIDTGCGISAVDQKSIFNRFTQVDESDTRSHSGTGLGTAIAKEIVELLDGSIGVKSEPEHGSTFWFTLPFIKQQTIDISNNKDLTQAKILAIANKDNTLLDLIDSLEGWGTDLADTDSASDAFKMLTQASSEHEPFHAIIITKPLIDIDALQFVQSIRTRPDISNIILILVANKLDETTHSKLLNTGFNFIFNNPINKSLLFNAIHASPLLGSHDSNIEDFSSYFMHSKMVKQYHILLADDNETNQRVIRRILEHGGHSVSVVENGERALDALERETFDICIIDMHMPVMGGLQAIKLFRFMYPKNTMPFVMLTANATTEAVQQCKEVGVDVYLTKPIRSHTLLDTIAKIEPNQSQNTNNENKLVIPTTIRQPNIDTPDSSDILNPDVINDLKMLDENNTFLFDLIQGFVKDGNALLLRLDNSTHDQYHEFTEAAHAFKGNAGSVGAVKLYKVCMHAQKISESEYRQNATQHLNQIRKDFLRTQYALWHQAHQVDSGQLRD
ncbi:BarA sensory histidine kinase (= VarS = GacS) [hydrothermal vent metagenome]|uniref:BarA sensory histidine kinase (= VarS = GacS) n=1 Tax=hydrothermal vent metagenome TaxID=652676 RepID=A0A3B1AA57_9ZZZZ